MLRHGTLVEVWRESELSLVEGDVFLPVVVAEFQELIGRHLAQLLVRASLHTGESSVLATVHHGAHLAPVVAWLRG